MAIADRIERKTLIVLSALGIAVFGSLFAHANLARHADDRSAC